MLVFLFVVVNFFSPNDSAQSLCYIYSSLLP